jgi:hypothetical protein
MGDLIYFLIGLIILVVVIAIIWKAGWLAVGLAPLDPTLRTVIYILALLLLAAVIWYYFGHMVHLP